MSDLNAESVVWYVSQEEWDWLMELLDAPAEVNPKLRELLSRPTVFDLQHSDGKVSD